MSTISFNNTTRTIRDVLQSKQSGRLITPAHQRNAKIWKLQSQQEFIDTCKRGLPFPSILVHEGADHTDSIEDGLQRLTTLEQFMNDEFIDKQSQKFSHWTAVQQSLMMNYQVPTLLFRNATLAERIEVFDRFQNGSPLKPGERLHSLGDTPLVSFTKKVLLSPGTGLHDRAVKVWGQFKTGDKDKRYSNLLKIVALVNGAAHGFTDGTTGITKKYESLRGNLLLPIDEAVAVRVLEEVFSIYEEVDRIHPDVGKKMLTKQADIGCFTGYIVYSLKTCSNWERLHSGWLAFLLSYRKDNEVIDTVLRKDRGAARNWNVTLWKSGCRNIFPEIDAFKGVTVEEDEDDDSIEE